MPYRDYLNTTEKRTSTGFPIGFLLLAICAIFAYLVVGGFLLDDASETAVYIPHVVDATGSR